MDCQPGSPRCIPRSPKTKAAKPLPTTVSASKPGAIGASKAIKTKDSSKVEPEKVTKVKPADSSNYDFSSSSSSEETSSSDNGGNVVKNTNSKNLVVVNGKVCFNNYLSMIMEKPLSFYELAPWRISDQIIFGRLKKEFDLFR